MFSRRRQLRTQLHQIKDSALFAVALWLAHWMRTLWDSSGQIESFSTFSRLYIALIPGVPLILELQGFYNRPLVPRRRETAWKLFKGSFITTVAVVFITFFFKESPSRGVFVLFGMFSFFLVFLSEEVSRSVNKRQLQRPQLRRKFVLIGTPEDTRQMLGLVRDFQDEGIELIRELDLKDYTVERLIDLLHEHSASGVIISARHSYFGEIEKAIQACEVEGLDAWLMADFFNTKLSRTSFDQFHGRPMLLFQSAPEASWQRVAKRVIDICGALLFLTVFAPLYLVFAILVKRGSPGPALFQQQRCGLHGEPFTMLKFRTMVTDAEQRQHELAALNEMTGPVFKVTNDPRVTHIGRTLRKYSFDEWPQLLNVLRGEMSLVGPRPLPVDEVRRFDDLAHRRRLSVKPGLTCLWQVSGRNEVRDFRDWVRLDLEYIDNWSLWLDIRILLRTIPAVLGGTGAK